MSRLERLERLDHHFKGEKSNLYVGEQFLEEFEFGIRLLDNHVFKGSNFELC